MKFLAVFVAVLAVAAAAPRRAQVWDVNQLSEAINSPYTDPAIKPYLVNALNSLMEAIWAGSPITSVPVVTPIGVVEPVSVAGILPGGNVQPGVVIPGGAADISPVAPVAPGGAIEILPVAPVMPGGAVEIAPAAVIEHAPLEVAEKPVAPAAVAEAASGKPLVQLIINVNAQAQEAAIPAGVAEVPVAPAGVIEQAPLEVAAPTPVHVVDGPVAPVAPVVPVSPVQVIEAPEVVTPIQVVDTPQIVSPVIVVEKPAPVAVEPIAVAEPALPAPVAPGNPIDVISVSPPEFNPVDVISPVPAVEVGSNDGILV